MAVGKLFIGCRIYMNDFINRSLGTQLRRRTIWEADLKKIMFFCQWQFSIFLIWCQLQKITAIFKYHPIFLLIIYCSPPELIWIRHICRCRVTILVVLNVWTYNPKLSKWNNKFLVSYYSKRYSVSRRRCSGWVRFSSESYRFEKAPGWDPLGRTWSDSCWVSIQTLLFIFWLSMLIAVFLLSFSLVPVCNFCSAALF